MKKALKRLVAAWGRRHPETLVRLRYLLRFHKRLNLNHPVDLNEKIQYLSLRTDTSAWTRLSDKYVVREYVRELGLEEILNSLYGVWDSADAIDFDILPERFILKATHGSGDCLVVQDKNVLDIEKTRDVFRHTLSETYGLAEGNLHYSRIKPRVVAEELLVNDEWSARHSSSLIDYKMWCFDGKAHYIWVCTNRTKTNCTQVMTYDRAWNAHPEYSVFNNHYMRGEVIPPPPNLEGMLDIAERLAATFPVVRVDLYNLNGRIVFGEMTFTSLGGLMNFYTPDFLQKAGSLISLPALS